MSKIIGSIVFYLVICLGLVYFASQIDEKKNVRFYMCLIILTLTLVSGLRHQSVGVDTSGYVDLISQLRNGYSQRLNNITEQGFISLSYFLVNVSSGYTLALMTYALITNTLIILRLYDYKDIISFRWAVFIYYMVFYFNTFNTIRQWIAIALIFYGTRYVGKSNLKYVLFAVLAISAHNTAIFSLLYIPLYYLSAPSKDKKVVIIKIAMLIFTIISGIIIYRTIVNNYRTYIRTNIYGNVSWLNILLLLFVCFIILYGKGDNAVQPDNEAVCNESISIRYESIAFIMGIVLTLMVFFTRYADRIGQYFLLFELVFFPYYIRKPMTRAITIIFVFSLCVYLRMFSFMSSGYGETPYIPFWM